MRSRLEKKIWSRMADGFHHRRATILRAQVKSKIKSKDGRCLGDPFDYDDGYDYCPVCGSACLCTCDGTGIPWEDGGVILYDDHELVARKDAEYDWRSSEGVLDDGHQSGGWY